MIAAVLKSAVLESAVRASAARVSEALRSAAGDSGSNGFDTNTVTPGVAGFIAIFLVAAAIVLLLLDMTRRVRRVRYRGEIGELLDAEVNEQAAMDRAAGDRAAKGPETDRSAGLEPPA